MREAMGALALAAMLGGCASAPVETAALGQTTAQPDFRGLSCRQITAELDLTQKAYARATGKLQRPALTGEPMASLYAPIAYTSSHPTQAARLKVRLDELQRASRAKRCASSGPKTATA
jgi:hypothetical protein